MALRTAKIDMTFVGETRGFACEFQFFRRSLTVPTSQCWRWPPWRMVSGEELGRRRPNTEKSLSC